MKKVMMIMMLVVLGFTASAGTPNVPGETNSLTANEIVQATIQIQLNLTFVHKCYETREGCCGTEWRVKYPDGTTSGWMSESENPGHAGLRPCEKSILE